MYKGLPQLLSTLVVSVLVLAPLLTFAQSPDISYIGNLFAWIDQLVFVAIPLLLGLAVLLFIWGVIKYFIYGADDESSRTTGRAYMLYALIGLVAVVAVWGLVNLMLQLLGIGTDAAPAPAAGDYFPTVN